MIFDLQFFSSSKYWRSPKIGRDAIFIFLTLLRCLNLTWEWMSIRERLKIILFLRIWKAITHWCFRYQRLLIPNSNPLPFSQKWHAFKKLSTCQCRWIPNKICFKLQKFCWCKQQEVNFKFESLTKFSKNIDLLGGFSKGIRMNYLIQKSQGRKKSHVTVSLILKSLT